MLQRRPKLRLKIGVNNTISRNSARNIEFDSHSPMPFINFSHHKHMSLWFFVLSPKEIRTLDSRSISRWGQNEHEKSISSKRVQSIMVSVEMPQCHWGLFERQMSRREASEPSQWFRLSYVRDTLGSTCLHDPLFYHDYCLSLYIFQNERVCVRVCVCVCVCACACVRACVRVCVRARASKRMS